MPEFYRVFPNFISFHALKHLSKAIIKNPLPDDPDIWDILDDCRAGEGELYEISANNAVIGAFYIEFYPDLMNLVLLGGYNINDWKDEFVNFLKNLMKERKIKHLSVIGRHGWSRIFKELKPVGTFYVYEGGL